MLELLLVPAGCLFAAAYGGHFKPDDKKKIRLFFETAKICVKRGDKLKYPLHIDTKEDDISSTYIYKLPLGIPSKLITDFEEVLEEGLNKPIRIDYKNHTLGIRVFRTDLPKEVPWSMSMLRPGTWQVPVGKSVDGWIYHDFEELPHLVTAGTTGFGKTVFLKHLFTSLIKTNPQHVNFYIIDLKYLVEFNRFLQLQQVKGAAGEPEGAYVLLDAVLKGMFEKLNWMKQHHITNISETNIKERTFIIVDESAELAPGKGAQDKKTLAHCQHFLSQIARLGFRLGDSYASKVVIDEYGLEQLPITKGRGIYKTVEKIELQTPWIKDHDMWNLLKEYERHEPIPSRKENPTDGNFIDD